MQIRENGGRRGRRAVEDGGPLRLYAEAPHKKTGGRLRSPVNLLHIPIAAEAAVCFPAPAQFRIIHASLDSMIYTPPFFTAMKATFPVISLDTANWLRRRRVARLRGYLQPSMSTPFTTSSAAMRDRYL